MQNTSTYFPHPISFSGPSVDILIGMNFEIVVHIQKYSSNVSQMNQKELQILQQV